MVHAHSKLHSCSVCVGACSTNFASRTPTCVEHGPLASSQVAHVFTELFAPALCTRASSSNRAPKRPAPRQAWTPRRSSGAASSPSPRRSASCPSSTPPTRALPAATWSATRPPSACSPAPAWRCCSRRATPRTWCRPRCGVFLFSCHDGTAGGCSQGLPRSREQANAPRVSLGSARGACLGAGISCPFVSSCLASEPGGRPGALIAATRH